MKERPCPKPLQACLGSALLLLAGFRAPVLAASSGHTDPPPAAKACIECHGVEGTAAHPAYPRLAGQRADYIVRQILDFKAGRRKDPVMSPVARKLDRQSLNIIAEYFSKQPVIVARTQGVRETDRGHELYVVHRCYLCHHTKTWQKASGLPHGPVIAGQNRDYLVKAMKDIRSNKRPADVYNLMHRSLDELTDADIEAVANYISTHTPAELLR